MTIIQPLCNVSFPYEAVRISSLGIRLFLCTSWCIFLIQGCLKRKMSYSCSGKKWGWYCFCMNGAATNTGKNSSRITIGSILIPHEWLEGMMKQNFPASSMAAIGKFQMIYISSLFFYISIQKPVICGKQIFFVLGLSATKWW